MVDRNGIRALHRTELRELGTLYRQIAADLSRLQEEATNHASTRHLNRLLARAHNIIYAGRKPRALDIVGFYRQEWPALFRRTLPYTALATGLFAFGAFVGLVLTVVRPDFMHAVLGPAMVRTIERREMWTHSILGMKPVASSAIMTNNLSVSFATFALGITGGVGTIYMMAMNGLLMGVIGAACWLAGMSLKLWSFVAPHGVLELPAIFIAGGAGFRIAHGLLFPGMLPRREALVVAGREAVRLLAGVIPLLVIAGIVEAFVSPTSIPVVLKFAVAAFLGSALAAYLSSGNQPADLPGSASFR